MTYDQLFSGRMLLMKAQRHIAQASLVTEARQGSASSVNYGIPWPAAKFTTPAMCDAFYIVERLLCALEKEFDTKVDAEKQQAKRRALQHRMNQQLKG